jgi:mannose-6-phosphate isomerase-like protein (cupin superfamily)
VARRPDRGFHPAAVDGHRDTVGYSATQFPILALEEIGATVAASYTLKKLTDVEDSAANFGLTGMEARFATDDLEAEDTGLSHHRLAADQRQAFGHKHEKAEEVYVVIGGSGRVKLDDEVVELERLDAIRVAPQVVRCFEAGSDGLEVLAFGPRHKGDGELIQGWWKD